VVRAPQDVLVVESADRAMPLDVDGWVRIPRSSKTDSGVGQACSDGNRNETHLFKGPPRMKTGTFLPPFRRAVFHGRTLS
jgi:hypothetical protein